VAPLDPAGGHGLRRWVLFELEEAAARDRRCLYAFCLQALEQYGPRRSCPAPQTGQSVTVSPLTGAPLQGSRLVLLASPAPAGGSALRHSEGVARAARMRARCAWRSAGSATTVPGPGTGLPPYTHPCQAGRTNDRLSLSDCACQPPPHPGVSATGLGPAS